MSLIRGTRFKPPAAAGQFISEERTVESPYFLSELIKLAKPYLTSHVYCAKVRENPNNYDARRLDYRIIRVFPRLGKKIVFITVFVPPFAMRLTTF